MEDVEFLSIIEHTLLKPEATATQIRILCQEAVENRFGAVCVLPVWVRLAADLLKRTPVQVCTVVGFPLGGNTTRVKVLEAAQAVADGAREIDLVINLGALKSGADEQVRQDIRAVVEVVRNFKVSKKNNADRPAGFGLEAVNTNAAKDSTKPITVPKADILIKVILETSLLNQAEKIRACRLAQAAGADMVKTSTGFGPGGATVEDVRLMRETIGPGMGIKAAGGIRSLDFALALLEAGATRLGTSAGVALAAEWPGRSKTGNGGD